MSRFQHLVILTLGTIAAIALFIMMVLIFVDVFGRYVFTAPIHGSSEIVQVCLIVMIFASLGAVSLNDRHIKVDILIAWLARHLGTPYRALIRLSTVLGLSLVTYQLVLLGSEAWLDGSTTEVLDIPLAPLIFVVAAFCAISAFVALFRKSASN